MFVRTAAERPMILAVGLFDGEIVNAGEPQTHQPVFIELPIFVAVRTKPVSRVVVAFVSKPNCDAVCFEGPELLDQAIVQFSYPFAPEKGSNLFSSIHKFRAVSPA